jgi:hypothetical protein
MRLRGIVRRAGLDLKHSGGRVLVGAGQHQNADEKGALLTRQLFFLELPMDAFGGLVQVTLGVPHMPSHDHSGKTGDSTAAMSWKVSLVAGRFGPASFNFPNWNTHTPFPLKAEAHPTTRCHPISHGTFARRTDDNGGDRGQSSQIIWYFSIPLKFCEVVASCHQKAWSKLIRYRHRRKPPFLTCPFKAAVGVFAAKGNSTC